MLDDECPATLRGVVLNRNRRGITSARPGSRLSFYVWVAVVLAVAVIVVVLGWHSRGGTPDPSVPGNHMSRTSAVIDSAILVFREGLETILVLAAVMASFLGANRVYRRPVAAGAGAGLAATVATWFIAAWFIGQLGVRGLDLQAATGLPAILVLLLVMNWFFHRVYWTGWIQHHHRRRRGLLAGGPETAMRRTLLGLRAARVHLDLPRGVRDRRVPPNLRVTFGSNVVLEGVTLGCLFTAAAGVLTFALHQRLPYKRLLVITGAMLVVVLFVMVGEEVNEMQLAGWIGTTNIGIHIPGWAGQWFSLFANVQTIAVQALAVAIVLGSYVAAQYLRVWRPRTRGERAARVADRPPTGPVGVGRMEPAGGAVG